MTKTHTETNTAIRNLDSAEFDSVSGGEVTMLYDVTVAGIRYTGWMNDSNGSSVIDVGGPGSGHSIYPKGWFDPN